MLFFTLEGTRASLKNFGKPDGDLYDLPIS